MIGIKLGLPCIINHKIIDPMSRYVILKGVLFSCKTTIIGVYAPNQEQTLFWDTLKQHPAAPDGEDGLILGDFNATMDSKIY